MMGSISKAVRYGLGLFLLEVKFLKSFKVKKL